MNDKDLSKALLRLLADNEKYRREAKQRQDAMDAVHLLFIGTGGPLNENRDKFAPNQQKLIRKADEILTSWRSR